MEAEVLLSPREAADQTGVNLRTIYRWTRQRYLSSVNGKVWLSEIEKIQDDLERSVPKYKFQRDFGVSLVMLRIWKVRGVIETIQVLGVERVLKTSYDKVKQNKRGRRPYFHPNYVLVKDLLRVTRLKSSVLKEYIELGIVKSRLVNRKLVIPIKEFEYWKNLMESTLRPSDVAWILNKPQGTIRRWRKNGRLREVSVLRRLRVAIDSVAETSSEKILLEAFLSKNEPRSMKILAEEQVRRDKEKA